MCSPTKAAIFEVSNLLWHCYIIILYHEEIILYKSFGPFSILSPVIMYNAAHTMYTPGLTSYTKALTISSSKAEQSHHLLQLWNTVVMK